MGNDLISRSALYEKAVELEAQALHMVNAMRYDDDPTEWRKWSAILTERTAFKYDVADAPSAQPERKKGTWQYHKYQCIGEVVIGYYTCSECGHANWIKEDNYCKSCGAEMRKETE